MPNAANTPIEHLVSITQLRDRLGFACQTVAHTGEPVIVQRYGKQDVVIVQISEWRALKRLEAAVRDSLRTCDREKRSSQ